MHRQQLFQLSVAIAALFSVSLYSFADLGGDAGIVLPYQGYLELNGTPVNTSTSLTFSVYDAPTGGSLCHSEAVDVVPADGAFAVNLGPLPESCIVSREVWLQVTSALGSLGGRQRVVPAMAAATSGKGGDFYVDGALDVNGAADVTTLVVDGLADTGSLDVTTNATIGGTLQASGNIRGNNVSIGDVGHGPGWAGVSHRDAVSTTDYALLQSDNAAYTLLNTSSTGAIHLRAGNSDRVVMDSAGNLNVTGRVLRTEYQLSCADGSAGQHYPFCCRIHVRNGDVACRVTNSVTGGAWSVVNSPFAAGSDGPYSLSCFKHVGSVNWPFCCRTGVSGATQCKYNTGGGLSGGWNNAASPF